jgi:RecA-family ATPase
MTRVLNAVQYVDAPRPQLSWLIPSYIPHPGLVLLIGEPKAGKSFLGLQIAIDVALGRSFLGQPISSASVLYLQFDTSETVWRQRLDHLRTEGVTLPSNLFFVHPEDQPPQVNILSAQTQVLLKGALDACNPKLVVVDVLRECHNGDEQDSTAMKNVGDALMTLFQGRTLLVIHHTHKLNDNYGTPNPANAARGSSYISGKADAIWLLWNNQLQIASRFHHDEKHHVQRERTGMWKFI